MANIIERLKGVLLRVWSNSATTDFDVQTATYDAPYPHCDSLVLHKPGECVYCDGYPAQQAQRERDGIPFTGHGPDPATGQRPLEVINRWGGNRPMTQADLDEEDRAWSKFWKEFDERAEQEGWKDWPDEPK